MTAPLRRELREELRATQRDLDAVYRVLGVSKAMSRPIWLYVDDMKKRAEKAEAELARARAEERERCAVLIEGKMYMHEIGAPGEGPFTRMDRTRKETVDQAAAAIRALEDE